MARKESKKVIVISAVNLTEGGPLTILIQCLSYLSKALAHIYEIHVLVHDKRLIVGISNINIIEFRSVKNSWLKRLWFEYYCCKKISKKLNAYLWLSLHDLSPRVISEIKAVYCHNPSPFFRPSIKEIKISPVLFLFSLFYKYLYRINIHSNSYVIVQQQWIRQQFTRMFSLNEDKIIVANPSKVKSEINAAENNMIDLRKESITTFFFPTFPRVFKNIEVIAKAVEILNREDIDDFKVIITIKGDENTYAKRIVNEYKRLSQISFIGAINYRIVYKYYAEVSCLIFPSKLETWGLPVSEFKAFDKPILLADLPYAHETVGPYSYVKFFKPDDYYTLAGYMKKIICKENIIFDSANAIHYKSPYAESWDQLLKILLGNDLQVL